MNFEIPARIEDYRARIADFIEREVLPLEADAASYDAHENIALPLLQTLRAKARAQGLWCLQLKPETGGAGLDKRGMAVCYEEMNRSIFGPVVFNSAAPDDGNMIGSGECRDAGAEGNAGSSRSSMAPSALLRDDGAASGQRLGSSMMLTTATRKGDR